MKKKYGGGTYVTDNTLTQTISNLRNALDDKNHELVITIPKKGYSLGVKPDFFTSDISVTKGMVLSCITEKENRVFLDNTDFTNLNVAVAILFFFFFILFSYNHYQMKVVDIKRLPILINLDEDIDAKFLSIYQREPYILLKKRKNGDYIVCQVQEGALACEQK